MQITFDALVDGIVDHHFALSSVLFDQALVAQLRDRLLFHQEEENLRRAGIGKESDLNKAIRGDQILWLDNESSNGAEQQFLGTISELSQYLNYTCFTGIRSWEFHYALYPVGAFYKRHLDQFQQSQNRKFSFILYLNDNWQPEDGGELVLYLPEGEQRILPEGGRCIVFRSDLIEHEVLPARRERMSLTGWLRGDTLLL